MSNATLDRLSGLALMGAFVLSLTGGLLHPIVGHESHSTASISHPGFPAAHLLVFLGGALLLAGLPGLYARIAPRAGILGLAGFTLYFLASATIRVLRVPARASAVRARYQRASALSF